MTDIVETHHLDKYDLVRVVAIILVVFIHSTELISTTAINGDITARVMDALLAIKGAGVPLFVMLSGALLLGKREPVGVFYKKRATRLLIPFLSWSAVACGIYCVQTGEGLFPIFFYKYIVGLLTNNIHGIYWFVYMIIGLYILTPVFGVIAQYEDRRGIYIVAIFALVVTVLCTLNPKLLDAQRWGCRNGIMLFYYLAGYIIVRDFVRLRNYRRYSIMAFLLCYILLTISCYLRIETSVIIIAVSVSLFCALLSIKDYVATQIVSAGGAEFQDIAMAFI